MFEGGHGAATIRTSGDLVDRRSRLVQLAERLVAEETIEHEEFEAMFADLPDARRDAGGAGLTPLPAPAPEPPAEPRGGTAPKPAPQPA